MRDNEERSIKQRTAMKEEREEDEDAGLLACFWLVASCRRAGMMD